MSEILEDSSIENTKPKGGLKVLLILTWIYLGFSLLGWFYSLSAGMASPDELEEQKAEIMKGMTPEVVEILGEEYFIETIKILEVSNQYYYVITGISISVLVIGLYSTYLMYKLQRNGFYFYIGYSLIPIFTNMYFFGTGLFMNIINVVSLMIAAIFIILYAVQLKQMK